MSSLSYIWTERSLRKKHRPDTGAGRHRQAKTGHADVPGIPVVRISAWPVTGRPVAGNDNREFFLGKNWCIGLFLVP
jgi:hypothetical protein